MNFLWSQDMIYTVLIMEMALLRPRDMEDAELRHGRGTEVVRMKGIALNRKVGCGSLEEFGKASSS